MVLPIIPPTRPPPALQTDLEAPRCDRKVVESNCGRTVLQGLTGHMDPTGLGYSFMSSRHPLLTLFPSSLAVVQSDYPIP